ncbi:MAG: glycerophosphodiester phosphodiesterase [Thermus sp.]
MPLLLGHRGAPRLARENTLGSLLLALEKGMDGVELDVQMTRDKVLVVHHDFALEDRPFSAWASWELPPHIPRLEEVLGALEGAYVNIELKSIPPSDGREAVLVELLSRFSLDRIWVSSFDPFALLRLRRLNPRISLGFLLEAKEGFDLLPCLGVDWVHPQAGLLTEEKARALKRTHKLAVWTVNDPVWIKQMADWGVDAVITDLAGFL